MLKKNIIETVRLILRPVSMDDFMHLNQMYTNPKVMKYIYNGSTFSEADAYKRVKGFVDHWEKHGFGMWILQVKSSNQIAGYAGLRYFEDNRPEFNGKIELGYIIDEPYWGSGYASEAVTACVRAGLNQYHLKRILATILPENIASQKIALKAGLKHTFDAEFDGLKHYIYEIKREEL